MTKTTRAPGRPPKAENIAARAAKLAVQQQMALPGMPAPSRRVAMRYDAAGMGRRMAGWVPTSSGPNRAIEGIERIRNRARDVSRNDWAGKSAVQKWATNLIGIGITPRFKRIVSKARKQQVTDLWNDFVKAADSNGVQNLYGLQTLVVKAWLDGGECFARRRLRSLKEGLPVPMQIQVLESDMVPMLDADTYPGLPQGNRIRSGIELDKRDQRVAYWFYKHHPGDNIGPLYEPSASELVRVLADDVAHVFEPERPGQLRGVSMLATILPHLRNVGDYSDAVLERQKLANLFVGFISRALPKLGVDDENYDEFTNQAIEGDPSRPLLGLRPGIMQELDDGQTVNWSNPPEAGTTYSDYMRTQHLGTSAGMGIPYELFSGDILNISDRTLRVMITEFRRLAAQRQWQVVIPMFCDKVSTWFAEAGVLCGKISMAEFDDVRRVEHAPHGWAHIHPVQDPQGKLLEISGGLRSRSSVIGERGDDPDMVDDERAADDAREQGLEIGPYSEAAAMAAAPASGDPNAEDPADSQQEKKDKAEMRAAELAALEAQRQVYVAEEARLRRLAPGADETRRLELRLLERTVDLLSVEPVGGKH